MSDAQSKPILGARGAHAIYCDDIRTETSGKITIVGAYGSELMVEEFPALLPQLAIYLTIWTPTANPFKSLVPRVYMDDEVLHEDPHNTERMEKAFQRESEKQREKRGNRSKHSRFEARQILRFVPFPFEKEGILRVLVETEAEILSAGAVVIAKAPQDKSEESPA